MDGALSPFSRATSSQPDNPRPGDDANEQARDGTPAEAASAAALALVDDSR